MEAFRREQRDQHQQGRGVKSLWVTAFPWLVPSLGECPVSLYLLFCLLESSRVVSCLGRLLYEIGVCIEVYHSFGGECIRECGVVYDGILMRSLLVPLLHPVFPSRNRLYLMILMRSIGLISGMAVKTLFKSWQA